MFFILICKERATRITFGAKHLIGIALATISSSTFTSQFRIPMSAERTKADFRKILILHCASLFLIPIYISLDIWYAIPVHTKRVAFHPHGTTSGGEFRYAKYLTLGARSACCHSGYLWHHCIRDCRISGAEVMRHAALYSTTFVAILLWWGVKRSRCPDMRTGWFCM